MAPPVMRMTIRNSATATVLRQSSQMCSVDHGGSGVQGPTVCRLCQHLVVGVATSLDEASYLTVVSDCQNGVDICGPTVRKSAGQIWTHPSGGITQWDLKTLTKLRCLRPLRAEERDLIDKDDLEIL